MAEITGVVQDIVVRDVAGGKKSYDIVVAGQKYGAGLYAPKCVVGDYVKFELDEARGYKNVGRGSLKVSKNKPPAEALAEAAATTITSTKGNSFDLRQDTISRQAALNSALAFVTILGNADALGLPAAGAKGKKAETLEALVDKYTQEFYERNTGTKWKDIAPSASETEVAPAEVIEDTPTPPDSEWN